MELYGLDGVDLVVSYTFFFVTKSANSQPPPASNRYGLTDCYAEKLKIKKPLWWEKDYLESKSTLNHVGKKTAAALCWMEKAECCCTFWPNSFPLVNFGLHLLGNAERRVVTCPTRREVLTGREEAEHRFSAWCDCVRFTIKCPDMRTGTYSTIFKCTTEIKQNPL